MTIAHKDWERWLDPRLDDVEEIRSLMAPPPPGSLDIYAITTAVNNVRNNGPELLEPLPLET
jgi:putative SOS response-associated peptidase YedK